jgi:hypothetical protein
MPDPLPLVQSPDYVGFETVNLPLKALGAVYDGLDPYATALGAIFTVRERSGMHEIFLPRGSRKDNGKVIYTHDLANARYVISRNGFEWAHLHLGEAQVSDEAKNLLRVYLHEQNIQRMNGRYMIEVAG